MTVEVGWLLGACGTLFGIMMGYSNWQRNKSKDIEAGASGSGEFKADINYIKRGIDDIRVDMKVQEKRVSELSERVIRVEESTKQAHKRIDELKD